MCGSHSRYCTRYLCRDIGKRKFRSDLFPDEESERHGGIEVSARDGREHCYDDYEDRACWQGIAKQCQRFISARKPLAHDTGADDGREQEGAAEKFSSYFPAARTACHDV